MADVAPQATVPTTENGAAQPAKIEDETPGFKVFAGNLAYSVNDEGLKAFFAPVQSDILSAQVILRGTRSAGYGFVAVSTLEAAQKAVDELNKKDLDGREVIVEIAKPADQKDKERTERKANRRPGRRGAKAVPGEVTEAEANGDVAKADAAAPEGTEEKPKKKKKSTRSKRKAKGDAAGTPASESAEDAATAPETKEAANKEPKEKKAPRERKKKAARPVRPAGEDPSGEPSKTTLFIASLPFQIDDAALATLFTDNGINVVSARVVKRRWGQPRKSKGYGFVDVGSEAEQQKAIAALDGKEIPGESETDTRNIAVKVAVNTPREDEGPEGEKAAESAPAATAETPAVVAA